MNRVSYIVYDGECPFCSRYVKMLRLREALGRIELVDARQDHHIVEILKSKKIDLNDGMALVQGDDISLGDECIHKIALMTTQSGVFNRVNAWIFRSARVSRLLYPVLRFGRNSVLKMLGRKKLN